MGLHSCCYRCLKYLVLIFNFAFWLLGLAVLVVALWLYFDTTTYFQVSAKATEFNKGLYVFIAIGFLMLVVGFLGCCGALKESQCMLCSFFVFLLIIFVAEVTVLVLAMQNEDQLSKLFKDSMKTLVQTEYTGSESESKTAILNDIQQQLQCCGANGFQDWRESAFNGKDGVPNLGATLDSLLTYQVPESCCIENLDKKSCESATKIDVGTSVLDSITGGVIPRNIYTKGCTEKLIHVFEIHREYFLAVVLFVAVIELIGMIVSMVLCCAIRRLDDAKV